MHRRWLEPLVLLLLAAVAIWDGRMVILTRQETMGAREAGSWVVLLGILLFCAAIVYGLLLNRGFDAESHWKLGHNVKMVVMALAILACYVFLIDRLGYLLSTALFFTSYLRIYGSYRWTPVVIGSLAIALVSTYTWAFLGMMLPTGILPWPYESRQVV